MELDANDPGSWPELEQQQFAADYQQLDEEQQLDSTVAAATTGNHGKGGRGGRGSNGRGGRARGSGGRGPPRPSTLSPQQQSWYAEGKCVLCGSGDHFARECPRKGTGSVNGQG